LFAFVVFGLLVGHRAVEDALMAAVPRPYHDVVGAFARRTRDTLYAIYVLQVATGAATFFFALPVFLGLGYGIPVTLAFIAGVLQFLPIVGPSVLLGALAVYHVAAGDLVAAVLVVVFGGVIVAWLPDILVRPQLARRAGHLPGTLYFIGFVGGLLTLGPVGIVAGPLAVALVVEAVALLEAENEIG
jgi:predicted PurR-regulated permease PerM